MSLTVSPAIFTPFTNHCTTGRGRPVKGVTHGGCLYRSTQQYEIIQSQTKGIHTVQAVLYRLYFYTLIYLRLDCNTPYSMEGIPPKLTNAGIVPAANKLVKSTPISAAIDISSMGVSVKMSGYEHGTVLLSMRHLHHLHLFYPISLAVLLVDVLYEYGMDRSLLEMFVQKVLVV
jgi:hypothetical protein